MGRTCVSNDDSWHVKKKRYRWISVVTDSIITIVEWSVTLWVGHGYLTMVFCMSEIKDQ